MTTEATTIASVQLSALSPLNAVFEGGIFKGVTTQKDGANVAVFLLPGKADDLTWEAAKAWAIGQGGELPTRPVASLLFANANDDLGPEWHWTSEEYNASSAWHCTFGDGLITGNHKSFEGSAVAVRLIPVTA